MKHKKRNIFGAVALCCMVWMSQMTPAHAQGNLIGVVDEDVMFDKYTKYRSALDAIDARAKSFQTQFDAAATLTVDEGKQFDAIIVKDSPSTQEQATLKKLVDAGTARQTEYQNLMANASRSETNNKRMKELEETADRNQARLRTIFDTLDKLIKKDLEDTNTRYTNAANDVLKQVAEMKGLTMVVKKRALLWSKDSIDITKDVLDKLNKG